MPRIRPPPIVRRCIDWQRRKGTSPASRRRRPQMRSEPEHLRASSAPPPIEIRRVSTKARSAALLHVAEATMQLDARVGDAQKKKEHGC